MKGAPKGWRVHFINIGRGKKSWTKDLPGTDLDEDAVAREASSVPMSGGVVACIDFDKGVGFVGAGFRRVGDLRVEPIPATERQEEPPRYCRRHNIALDCDEPCLDCEDERESEAGLPAKEEMSA